MTVRVSSARITYRGPDRFDITRQSGGVSGAPFAPSWAILRPALAARRRAELSSAKDAAAILARAWADYVPAFTEEMRVSYRRERGAWDELLQKERVTLACFCVDPTQCHRAILRTTILPALGAVDAGEVVVPPPQQTRFL